jgi:hypothetical protein
MHADDETEALKYPSPAHVLEASTSRGLTHLRRVTTIKYQLYKPLSNPYALLLRHSSFVLLSSSLSALVTSSVAT